jgi:hypothetical protein
VRATLAAAAGIVGVGALTLHLMGHRLWCACGSPAPWSWDIWSPHNSQHLIDPYTFTHVLHGVLFYALLRWIVGPRWPQARALLALTIEVSWEIVENTPAVIAAYRKSTIALNYSGDTIANSLGDIAACLLGYLAAMSLPWAVSAVGVVVVEVALLLTIRDNLLLSVLMLLRPIEAIKAWQLGG